MISYDDATSFGKSIGQLFHRYDIERSIFSAAKGKFIDDSGLAGFAVWHIAGDSNDILVNAISGAMGLEQVCS